MSRFFSEKLSDLVPYVPGEQPQDQQYTKLNTNESPFPPSPAVVQAMRDAGASANLYCDPQCRVQRHREGIRRTAGSGSACERLG